MRKAQAEFTVTSGGESPAFTFTYPVSWGEKWHNFEVNDIQLLQAAELSPLWFSNSGLFIASLNHRNQLRELLEACGYAMANYGTRQFIFRTDHPTVTRWANRWGALVSLKQGHRPRYLMDEVSSPSFFTLCCKAHELRRINVIRRLKWN